MKERIDEVGNLDAGENWRLVRDILKDIYSYLTEKIEEKKKSGKSGKRN